MEWQDWKFDRAQIEAQFYWACAVGLFTLFAIARAIKTFTLRVTLDEAGMTYGGLHIPYADMTEFTGFNRKGWVFLNYGRSGEPKKFRLDNQRVDKYEDIVLVICEKTDLQSPLPEPEETESEDDADAMEQGE